MSHLTATLDIFEKEFKDIDLDNCTVLDIGCKDHNAKERLEKLGLKWTGCDKKPTQPQGDIITADMTDLNSFSLPHYDIIFVCHSLEHCINPIKALEEFKDRLFLGGYLFISLPCPCEYHILKSDEDHIFCFSEMQIKRLLIYLGFRNIKCWEGQKGEGGYPNDQFNIYAICQK